MEHTMFRRKYRSASSRSLAFTLAPLSTFKFPTLPIIYLCHQRRMKTKENSKRNWSKDT